MLLVVGGGFWFWQGQRETNRQIAFVVPVGTNDRIAAGETVNVLPSTITMTLGVHDVLVIRNEDRQDVQIGPYKIAPGQQFRQQFFNAGTFDLVCSIHAGEKLRVLVTK